MNVKTTKILLAFFIAVAFATTDVGTGLAEQSRGAKILCTVRGEQTNRIGLDYKGKHNVRCDEPVLVLVFCQAWANLPYKSGSKIYGTGGTVCTQSVSQIKIDVEVRNRTLGTATLETKFCYNVSSCTATANITWYSGHCYDTAVSGYVGMWNGYAQSNQKCF